MIIEYKSLTDEEAHEMIKEIIKQVESTKPITPEQYINNIKGQMSPFMREQFDKAANEYFESLKQKP